jgi:hypothetical protein
VSREEIILNFQGPQYMCLLFWCVEDEHVYYSKVSQCPTRCQLFLILEHDCSHFYVYMSTWILETACYVVNKKESQASKIHNTRMLSQNWAIYFLDAKWCLVASHNKHTARLMNKPCIGIWLTCRAFNSPIFPSLPLILTNFLHLRNIVFMFQPLKVVSLRWCFE